MPRRLEARPEQILTGSGEDPLRDLRHFIDVGGQAPAGRADAVAS
jgi:hypothetical protein